MRISAVILAGGRGERLFPLTCTRPKPLCPVGNVYPLEKAIALAREAGAEEIIVTAGYMAAAIENYTRGMENVVTLREETPLSTAGAVKNAHPSGETIIVLCGDTLCGFSLLPAVKHHKNGDADVTVVTTRTKSPTDYGVVTISDGYITSFSEKPSWSGVESDEVNTGIYILRRRALDLIPSGTPYDFGSELFPKMLSDGRKIGAYSAEGYWCDMGSPQSYYLANMAATGGKSVIDGSAVLHEKCSVSACVLLSDVYVGRGTTIKNSIICENVKIGRNCRIENGCIVGGNCIIEDGCVLKSGVVITNGVVLGKDTHVMKSIYSREFKTKLFDSELGVGGIYGSGFDIADAVALGESICSLGNDGVRVGVMSGSGGFSRILAGVMIGGIKLGGGEVYDLERGFLAECSFAAPKYNLDYTVFVDVNDSFGINISVFEKHGMFLPREDQRRLERLFFRRSRPKNTLSDDSEAEVLKVKDDYRELLCDITGDMHGKTVIINRKNAPSELFASVFEGAGGKVESDGGGHDIWDITPDGRRVTARTKDGTFVSYWHLWCYVMGEEVKKGSRDIAMPTFSPITAAEYLGSLGGRVVYYSDSENDDLALAGGQQIATDGCHLALRALRLLGEQGISLGDMMALLPKFYIRELAVPVEEDEKAERARYLHDTCDDSRRCSAFVFGTGRVSVMPSNGAFFKIFAEAVSSEAAEEIALEVKKKIGKDKKH